MIVIFFLSIAIFAFPCFAGSVPNWVLTTPEDTATAKFYVVCGDDFSQIETRALNKAILDNYGVSFQSYRASFQSMKQADYAEQTNGSLLAHVVGFKEVNRAFAGKEKCALYSYSKKQIEIEQKRLKNIKLPNAAVENPFVMQNTPEETVSKDVLASLTKSKGYFMEKVGFKNPLIDNNHRFVVKRAKSKPFISSTNAPLNKILTDFQKWDYTDGFTDFAASYSETGKMKVYVRTRFNIDKYSEYFQTAVKPFFKKYARKSYDDIIHLTNGYLVVPDFAEWSGCNYWDDIETKALPITKKLVVTVYLKNGKTVKKEQTVKFKRDDYDFFCSESKISVDFEFDFDSSLASGMMLSLEPIKRGKK